MKLIILDRDGVINEDSNDYIKSPEECLLIPGSLDAIAKLNHAGFKVVIATNQSGIARGFYDLAMLNRIHEKIKTELKKVGGHIDDIFFCPHHPDDQCECRKPKPGLLFQIQKKYSVDLKNVFFVGDKLSDVETAHAAGCKPVLVLTGKGAKTLRQKTEQVPTFKDLAEAVDYVFAHEHCHSNRKRSLVILRHSFYAEGSPWRSLVEKALLGMTKSWHDNNIFLFLRSLLFSIYMAAGTFFYSFLCIFARPFPFRFRYAMIVKFTGAMVKGLKIICGVNYKIEGLENIPKNKNGIVMSKHQSTWETFFLPTIFPHSAIILKRELLWIPFFGWGLANIDPIAIDRKNKSSAMNQIIAKGKKCLDEGRWILVFPEGTRIPPGHIGNYKMGGARLAVETNYPIIPVAHNAGNFWRRRGFLKYPGTIHVIIGPLIETQNKKPEDVLAEVKSWIEGKMNQINTPT